LCEGNTCRRSGAESEIRAAGAVFRIRRAFAAGSEARRVAADLRMLPAVTSAPVRAAQRLDHRRECVSRALIDFLDSLNLRRRRTGRVFCSDALQAFSTLARLSAGARLSWKSDGAIAKGAQDWAGSAYRALEGDPQRPFAVYAHSIALVGQRTNAPDHLTVPPSVGGREGRSMAQVGKAVTCNRIDRSSFQQG
jgi:hypothetical protein